MKSFQLLGVGGGESPRLANQAWTPLEAQPPDPQPPMFAIPPKPIGCLVRSLHIISLYNANSYHHAFYLIYKATL